MPEPSATTSLGTLDWGVLAAYVAAMIALGAVLQRRIRGFTDYFLAGGHLTAPLLVCTLVSTYYELDVTFATSEIGFYNGLVAWFWFSRPYYLAILLAALVVARRVKRFPFLTLPDLLEHAYGTRTRVTGAVACFVYSLPITALGGMAAMFEMLGWPPGWGLLIGAGIAAIYTLMGGLWADAITDTVQFVLMCVAIAIAIPPALEWVGGWSFVETLPPEHLTATGGIGAGLLAAYACSALTVFVEPAFYQRIFAAKDTREVTRALMLGIVLWAAYDWGVTILGMIGRSAVEQGLLAPETEGVHALLAVTLQVLPAGLKGLLLGGIVAAAMSSIDSYSLLASGNLVYDIYRPLFRPDLSEAAMLRMTRVGVFVVMGLGIAVSTLFTRLADAWIFAASVLTSVVFVPVLAALFLQPKREAGGMAAGAGLIALIAFYVAVYGLGEHVPDEGTWVWRVAGLEIWREFAVLFALPVSALAFAAVQLGGRR